MAHLQYCIICVPVDQKSSSNSQC